MPAAENGYFLANMIFWASIEYERLGLIWCKKGDTLLYIPISKRHFQKVRFQVIPISAYSVPRGAIYLLSIWHPILSDLYRVKTEKDFQKAGFGVKVRSGVKNTF